MRNKCVVAHAGSPNWLYTIFPSIFEKRYHPGLSYSLISFNILNLGFERLKWCIENKNLIFNRGIKAAATAKQFTWERFRSGLVDFYETQIH